jgi:hypothetical protein
MFHLPLEDVLLIDNNALTQTMIHFHRIEPVFVKGLSSLKQDKVFWTVLSMLQETIVAF